MRLIVQRSNKSQVSVAGKVTGKITHGLVVFVGFKHDDDIADLDYLVDKLINLRIFNDDDGVMNLSLLDVGGEILSISQFTLYADTTKGRRPSYINAMPPKKAKHLYELFNDSLRKKGINVEEGVFGAVMKVAIENDGPITITLESRNKNE